MVCEGLEKEFKPPICIISMITPAIYELNPYEFEDLVIYICRQILGIGTLNFSEGKDGGRDGKFEGTAQKFPSTSEPWKGKFIIQAKREHNPLASCSDSGFKKKLDKELEKIKKLKENGEVDYYLLFTTRKLPANSEKELVEHIIKETGIKDAKILAREWIDGTIKSTPNMVITLGLNKYSQPLRVFPENIKKVIIAFIKNKEAIKKATESPYSYDFEFDIDEKNELNKISEEYFKQIKEKSQAYFYQIKRFLENPANLAYQNNYYNIVEEINNKVVVRKDEFAKFEEIFETLYDCLYVACPELQEDSRLIYVFLHFMYCNCDIGEKTKRK